MPTFSKSRMEEYDFATRSTSKWLVVQKRLAIVKRLEKFGVQMSYECVFYSNTKETFEHLYFDCQVTKTLWGRMCNWMGIQRSIDDWIKTSIFVMIIYIIWRERNKISFYRGRLSCADKVPRETVMHILLRGQHKASYKPIINLFFV